MARRRIAWSRVVTVFLFFAGVVGFVGWIVVSSGGGAGQQTASTPGNAPSDREAPTTGGGDSDLTVRIAGDSWNGYFLFRNDPEFQKRLAPHGIGLSYQEVLDQRERIRMLRDNEIDIAVTTLDAYLLAGAASDYPGVIAFAIDESDGGDGIVLGPGLKDLDALGSGASIAFAADTPSDFLLSVVAYSFQNVDRKNLDLKPVEVADQAFAQLKAGDVDATVLWEPFTSRAAREIPGSRRVLDTGAKMDDVIIDVAVVSKSFIGREPDRFLKFVETYFETVAAYLDDRPSLVQAIARDGGSTVQEAKLIVDGIDFLTLEENIFTWYGLGETDEKFSEVLEMTAAILEAEGKLSTSQIPDFRTIVDARYVDALKSGVERRQKAIARFAQESDTQAALQAPEEETFEFDEVNPDQVEETTTTVGSLNTQRIYFPSGSARLDPNAKEILRNFAKTMRRFPSLYVRVEGHTDDQGGDAANKTLSEERARAIADYLVSLGFNRNKFIVRGFGEEQLLPRDPDLSQADWRAMNRRTEFILVEVR